MGKQCSGLFTMGKQCSGYAHAQGDETDRKSQRQLQQHFEVFMHLLFETLTEDLIKSNLGMLMKDVNGDGNVVNAGVF